MADYSSADGFLAAATHAQVMGRHVVLDTNKGGSVRFDWPAVRLSFSDIVGTTFINICLKGGRSVFGYRVSVHGSAEEKQRQESQKILACSPIFNKKEIKVLAMDLDPLKSYNLEIWKRDDPGDEVVEVFGLVVDPGTTAKKSRQGNRQRRLIEFVGDSDTVGFGNLGKKSGLWYSLICELPCLMCGFSSKLREATDASQSWAADVGKELNVDYSIVAKSGIGAKHSVGMSDNMIKLYPRTLSAERGGSASQPLEKVDAVVIYIGNNDEADLKSSFQLSDRRLADGFRELLAVIRNLRGNDVKIVVIIPHKDAVLACMSTERECNKTAERQNRVWRQVVEEMGGQEKNFYLLENRHEPQIKLNSREDFGMMLHWNAQSCKKWANGLTERLDQILRDND